MITPHDRQDCRLDWLRGPGAWRPEATEDKAVRIGWEKRIGAVILAVMVAVVAGIAPTMAQPKASRIQFIRDAEIEHSIRQMAQPLFAAAGVDSQAVSIVLVRDDELNAFVAGGMNLFIHTGLLLKTEDAGQLMGVLAHEIGHIAGGHLLRGKEAMEGASAEAILAMLLGAAAAAGTRNPGAAAAIMLGGQEMAMRSLMAFSRTQEASADQAALSYLEHAGLSAKGMLTFLETLQGQELMPEPRQSQFVRTHPLTRDRVDTVRRATERSSHTGKPPPPALQEQHRRMVAKLRGFLQPSLALTRYRADDNIIAARYGRAVALYQRGEIKPALALIDGLLAAEPKNPFFHELKGQVLLENGRVPESIAPYRRSVELRPDSPLLRQSLAHALLESGDNKGVDEAIRNLEVAMRHDHASSSGWRLLAAAYGRKQNNGMVAYALAEEALASGDRLTARTQAERARRLLPANSPGWLRAQDIDAVTQKKE